MDEMTRKEAEIMIRRHMRRIDDLAIEYDRPPRLVAVVALLGLALLLAYYTPA